MLRNIISNKRLDRYLLKRIFVKPKDKLGGARLELLMELRDTSRII